MGTLASGLSSVTETKSGTSSFSSGGMRVGISSSEESVSILDRWGWTKSEPAETLEDGKNYVTANGVERRTIKKLELIDSVTTGEKVGQLQSYASEVDGEYLK